MEVVKRHSLAAQSAIWLEVRRVAERSLPWVGSRCGGRCPGGSRARPLSVASSARRSRSALGRPPPRRV